MYKKKGRSPKIILAFVASLAIIAFVINNSTSILKLSYPLKYRENVFKNADTNNIDPYLVFAVIKAESSFNPKATSKKNARGLMQVTEKTGSWAADSLNLKGYSKEKLYEPETNIQIGCWYLGQLMREFNNNIELVICAYNGGSGNVNEWLKDENLSNSGTNLKKIPFAETDRYLKRVKEYYSVYKKLYENKF